MVLIMLRHTVPGKSSILVRSQCHNSPYRNRLTSTKDRLSPVMESSTAFMERLDQEYRSATGLSDRCDYSIYFSQIIPSPLLILGFNPGGDPSTWNESALASTSFFENGEHEYVDCDYPIAKTMRQFLREINAIKSYEELRSIPKSNIIFRRSRSMDQLGISEKEAILEAKPVLTQMIERVTPTTIICEGASTLRQFKKHYCDGVDEDIDNVRIETPNGANSARIYKADRAHLIDLNREVTLLGIGHPSKYAGRQEWRSVVQAASKLLSAP